MGERLTIDELARRVGMTTRNVRAHQTRGLLPPPTIVDRVGYYDRGHLDRLELIQELQAEGLNLAAIGWLLGAGDADDTEIRRLRGLMLEPWHHQQPIELTTPELVERMGAAADLPALDRALQLGILEPLDDGRWRVLQPTILRAGEELAAMGVPLVAALDVFEELQAAVLSIARTFVGLFEGEVVEPLKARGATREDWREVGRAIERLRPLASETLLATFQRSMTRVVGEALRAHVTALAERST